MSSLHILVLTAALVGSSLGGHSALNNHAAATRTAAAPTQSIVDIAVGNPDFSTLVAALKAADLVGTLQGAGPFTVFAPNNAAFAKIPEATLNGLLADVPALKAVLLRHVVPANIPSKDVPQGTTPLKTAGGEEITVNRNPQTVTVSSKAGSAAVVKFDVLATNGVIHVIDTVI